jgi:Rrf2 family iron-sulfur cluster assembly transcriptional regulator
VRVVRKLEAETEPNDPSVGSPLAHEVVWPLWEQLREDMMTQLDTITIEDLCEKARNKGLVIAAKSPAGAAAP